MYSLNNFYLVNELILLFPQNFQRMDSNIDQRFKHVASNIKYRPILDRDPVIDADDERFKGLFSVSCLEAIYNLKCKFFGHWSIHW